MNVAQIDQARSMVKDSGSSGKKSSADTSFADLLNQKNNEAVNNQKQPPKTEGKPEEKPAEPVKKEEKTDEVQEKESDELKSAGADNKQETVTTDKPAEDDVIVSNYFLGMPIIPAEKDNQQASTALPDEVLPLANDAVLAKMQIVTGKNQAQNEVKPQMNMQMANPQDEAMIQADANKQTGVNVDMVKAADTKMVEQTVRQVVEQPAEQMVVAADDGQDEALKQVKQAPTEAVGVTNPNILSTVPEEKAIPVNDSSALLQRQTTQQVTDQIISRMRADGAQQFTMQLHPEKLGRVTVNMLLEAGHMTLKVETHSQLAHNLLLGNIAELKNTLENNGIQVTDVEIMSYAGQQQDAEQQGKQYEQDGKRGAAAAFDMELEEEEQAAEMELAESLLDYSV